MATALEPRILLERDADMILAFEKARLETEIDDHMDREMKSWGARWRLEALNHYLPQGWSFGVYENGKLQGYVLGQPYLFHRGHTQTLWIEHLSALTPEAARALIDTAHKWAKDKHLQTVLIEKNAASDFILEHWPQALVINDGLIELRSTRF